MADKILYSPEEVQNLISKSNTVVVDIREEDDYKKSHIPGAVSIPDIFFFLAETTDEGLKEFQEKFQALFSAAGITSDKKVIIYEDAFDKRYGASCRGYWFLTYLGHPDTGILDGGFSAWNEAGFAVDDKIPTPEPSKFELNIHDDIIATKDEVLASLSNPNVKLLDNRDREEWTGKSSSPYGVDFAPRKGRLPARVGLSGIILWNAPKGFHILNHRKMFAHYVPNMGSIPTTTSLYIASRARAFPTPSSRCSWQDLNIYATT